jgi:hypothetical protein
LAFVLRVAVEEATVRNVLLSPTQAILLLHLAGWDLQEAVDTWNSMSIRDNFLRLGLFDSMRERLQEEPALRDAGILAQQDERLALLCNITARADWYSMLQRLKECRWNVIDAIKAWFMTGIARALKPKRSAGITGVRNDINGYPRQWPAQEDCIAKTPIDEDWGEEPDSYMPEDEKPKMKPKDGCKPTIRDLTSKREGFLLTVNERRARDPAHLGIPNPTLFLIEWIAKGKYWSKRFKGNMFEFPELEDVDNDSEREPDSRTNRVPFDWNVQLHVDKLNNWRRQCTVRLTGEHQRESTQKWTEEEKEFLIKLNKVYFEESKRANPSVPGNDLLPMTIPTTKKNEWEKLFNQKFEGTIPEGSDKPRVGRKAAALMTQRGRISELVNKYKVTPDQAWFKKQKDAEDKRKAKQEAEEKRKSEKERKETAMERDAGDKRKRDERDSPDAEGEEPENEPSESGEGGDTIVGDTLAESGFGCDSEDQDGDAEDEDEGDKEE